jgi:L-serine kinase (ATP) / ParB family transcriptional regulator, heme-responsive regulator
MLEEIPRLEFLPIASLILHEWHDDQRTPPLIERIRESGLFRNPPVVAPLPDGSGRFMVLDGANRFTALQQMGYRDILVQVVQPDGAGVRLENWNHVIWGLTPATFLAAIRSLSGTSLVETADLQAQPELIGGCGLALIQIPGSIQYNLCADTDDLLSRVHLLNDLVMGYISNAHLDRTNVRQVDLLVNIYPGLSGLVIFPHFDVVDVLELAGAGYLLPAGITRFTIAPRALHINYPLSELAADKPVEEKNTALRQWIQERIARKGVRYYAEPTFLFDE